MKLGTIERLQNDVIQLTQEKYSSKLAGNEIAVALAHLAVWYMNPADNRRVRVQWQGDEARMTACRVDWEN